MIKKTMIVSIAVIFACTSLLMMTSCAKKHVKMEEEVTKAVPEKKGAVVEDKAKKADVTLDAEKKSREEAAKKRKLEQQKADAAKMLRIQMRIFEAGNIYFDFDKSDLIPDARAILKRKAEWLQDNPQFRVRIEGHCDERGTNEYNIALGERRANAAFRFLNALGISGERLDIVSYGEEKPADPGHNSEAWDKNRRDEFKLIK